MNESRQRSLVSGLALGLTALLLGLAAGAAGIWYNVQERLQDRDFLSQQLERLAPQADQGPAEPARALVRVSHAQRKEIQPERKIIGRLVEVRKVTVASEVTGKIIELPVEIGTSVIGGQTVLARLDDIWPRLASERAQATLDSTRAQLAYQQAELRRGEQLSQTNVVTASELDSLRASVTELEAKQAEARAVLAEEKERIARSVILAPFDGAVVAKQAELGGYLSPGNPIVDIVSSGELDALLMVPESMINLIELDQTLAIGLDALGEEARGKVVSITPYGPSASRTFPVRVRLDDQKGRLKAGMSVTAPLVTEAPREALVVGRDAVLVRPDGSTVWVAVPDGSGPEALVQPAPVAITARMTGQYAIEPETDAARKLLVAGASVVVEGAERLTPGQQVRIVGQQEG